MVIFFDVDGTLLDNDYAQAKAATELYNAHSSIFSISEDRFINLWWELTDEAYRKYLAKEINFSDQRKLRMKSIFNTAGVELSDIELEQKFNTYFTHYQENLKLYDDVIPCLQMINKVRLGIITNGDYENQVLKLNKLGIKNYFTYIIASGEFGVAKPSKDIFNIACEKADEIPSNCFYIGDIIDIDVHGSRNAGMKGIWINRNGGSKKETGIIEINSLLELPKLVI